MAYMLYHLINRVTGDKHARFCKGPNHKIPRGYELIPDAPFGLYNCHKKAWSDMSHFNRKYRKEYAEGQQLQLALK